MELHAQNKQAVFPFPHQTIFINLQDKWIFCHRYTWSGCVSASLYPLKELSSALNTQVQESLAVRKADLDSGEQCFKANLRNFL